MPDPRRLATALVCALTASAHAAIDDLTNWDLYTDSVGATPTQSAAMTGSSALNLAQLNFINNVDQDAGFDIGYSSVNANTVDQATSGYYFSTDESFTVRMHFILDLTDPAGVVGIGLGIGEDRAGENSVGIGFAAATSSTLALQGYAGALTDSTGRTVTSILLVPNASSYSGSLSVAYDATTGDVTVGAAAGLGTPDPLAPTNTTTFAASEFANWNGDDKLLVSFFLRSDSQLGFNNWTGDTAGADFFDFTVVQGSPIQVPEPGSLALLGLGSLALTRHRR